MKEKKITAVQLNAFVRHMRNEEREPGTIEKYLRDIQTFAVWAGNRVIHKERSTDWKAWLKAQGFQPETINSKLSALNKFFAFMGWDDCRVKYLKIQRRLFRRAERDLTKEEYKRLLDTANDQGKDRLALLMELICATGIRVSEVKYITVEAAQSGRVDVSLKGKIRTILI
ncbi:MAG: site-specific integrase, partial [Oscillospiraceae bacterium]|nr:site-specific integrase [Oscillospiraceae bacterium]